jgi:hypothetical protein
MSRTFDLMIGRLRLRPGALTAIKSWLVSERPAVMVKLADLSAAERRDLNLPAPPPEPQRLDFWR